MALAVKRNGVKRVNDWENLAKKAAYFVIGGTQMAIEGAEKALQELSDETQKLLENAIEIGEQQYNEWSEQQRNNPVTPREDLRRRLFTLVRGDWQLAERLLKQARRSHPGQSEDWYWEKVIYDLERDLN